MRRSSYFLTGRIFEILLGMIFTLSALLKAYDVHSSAIYVSAYGVVRELTHVYLAVGISIVLETIIAVMFLTGIRIRGLLHLFTFGLLVGFSLLIVYGWLCQGLKDCGCFGKYIQMSPAASISKNIVLMVLVFAGWFWTRKKYAMEAMPKRSLKMIVLSALTVMLIAGASIHGVVDAMQKSGVDDSSKSKQKEASKEKPFAQFQIDFDGEIFDLGREEYLVVMLSVGCHECRGWVEQLNDLMLEDELPPIVSLMMDEDDELDEFEDIYSPMFPRKLIDSLVLMKFIDKEPPRLILIRNGKQEYFWDTELPELSVLQETVAKSRAGTLLTDEVVKSQEKEPCLTRLLKKRTSTEKPGN